MISVTVRLHSAISSDRDRWLAVALIFNDATGTDEQGNYRYAIAHQTRGQKAMEEFVASGGKKHVWKSGRVVGYSRMASVWRLVGMVLKDARQIR